MILVDLNQVMISNLMAQLHSRQSKEVDEELLRHMVLNGIRSYRTKFFEEYGEIVICCDDTNNWRKEHYPYYKAHRKTNRDESVLDWPNIFDCLNVISRTNAFNFLNCNFLAAKYLWCPSIM